ncbi:hypothetical protein ACFFJ4_00690 [Xanthomonas dyei]|nr:hypothetical protein [Xanthomonas dyei]
MSSKVNGGKAVKIIAVFARRPKLTDDPMIIEGKINHEIVRFAQKAHSYGIPTIAAFCAARSLFELKTESIRWISLMDEDPNEDVFFFERSSKHELLKSDGSPISTISTELLANHLLSKTDAIAFNHGVEAMSDLRHELSDYQFFMGGFGSTYKPVYLLIEQ